MANTSIYRNIASTGNSDICTVSCWFKRGILGAEYSLFGGWRSNTTRFQVRIRGGDDMDVEWGYSSSWYSLITNRLFRDPAAWMHLVLAIDSTQAVAANRTKLYINGVQETSFSTENYIPQNNDTLMTTSGDEMIVGGSNASSSAGSHQNWMKGEMSHFQFVDGLQLAPTEFGSFDATSGIWKIKTGAYATPGTNGFFLKMEDRTNLDLDSSSNALTFTTGGTLTATYDNPSNNFATFNPLFKGTDDGTLSNGNLSYTNTAANWRSALSSLGVTSGKWYWEIKNTANDAGAAQRGHIGCVREEDAEEISGEFISDSTTNGTNVGWDWHAGGVTKNAVSQYTGSTVSSGGICSIALDLDNDYIYFAKNGTWEN